MLEMLDYLDSEELTIRRTQANTKCNSRVSKHIKNKGSTFCVLGILVRELQIALHLRDSLCR